MKKNIWQMCAWLAIVISVFTSQNLAAETRMNPSMESASPEETSSSEFTLLVALKDLYFNETNLVLNVEGTLHPIQSLQRAGDQWLATITCNTSSGVHRCPRGHPLCVQCGQCHVLKCQYYVPPCNRWN